MKTLLEFCDQHKALSSRKGITFNTSEGELADVVFSSEDLKKIGEEAIQEIDLFKGKKIKIVEPFETQVVALSKISTFKEEVAISAIGKGMYYESEGFKEPFVRISKDSYVSKKDEKSEMVDMKISFADLAKKLNIDLDTIQVKDLTDLGLLIKSYDVVKKEVVYKPLNAFVVKESVSEHYEITSSSEILKTTSVHRTWSKEDEQWETSADRFAKGENIVKIDSPMQVVDISVGGTECYIANGQINHNTTPGGNSVKFAATVRIKLQGKTPVVELDPFAEAEHRNQLNAWNLKVEGWKNQGKVGDKPEKPKKQKGDEIIIGYDVTARTDKNKVGPPRREAEFRIVFSQGIIEEDAWLDYSIKYNIVKAVSSFEYQFLNHPELGKFKRDGWKEMLSDVALHEEVRSTICEKLVRSPIPTDAAVPVEPFEEEEVEEVPEEMKD